MRYGVAYVEVRSSSFEVRDFFLWGTVSGFGSRFPSVSERQSTGKQVRLVVIAAGRRVPMDSKHLFFVIDASALPLRYGCRKSLDIGLAVSPGIVLERKKWRPMAQVFKDSSCFLSLAMGFT